MSFWQFTPKGKRSGARPGVGQSPDWKLFERGAATAEKHRMFAQKSARRSSKCWAESCAHRGKDVERTQRADLRAAHLDAGSQALCGERFWFCCLAASAPVLLLPLLTTSDYRLSTVSLRLCGEILGLVLTVDC